MAYGKDSLMFVRGGQFLTIDSSSDTLALRNTVTAVSLYATTDCWVNFGAAPTAAPPGAEKTDVDSFFLPASTWVDIAVPEGTDAVPILVAAIRATADGVLYVSGRSDV